MNTKACALSEHTCRPVSTRVCAFHGGNASLLLSCVCGLQKETQSPPPPWILSMLKKTTPLPPPKTGRILQIGRKMCHPPSSFQTVLSDASLCSQTGQQREKRKLCICRMMVIHLYNNWVLNVAVNWAYLHETQVLNHLSRCSNSCAIYLQLELDIIGEGAPESSLLRSSIQKECIGDADNICECGPRRAFRSARDRAKSWEKGGLSKGLGPTTALSHTRDTVGVKSPISFQLWGVYKPFTVPSFSPALE